VADRFNERSLLSDVIEKWGAYGAHADVVRWMIQEIERLRTAGDALADGVRTGRWDAPLEEWDDIRQLQKGTDHADVSADR
jgi:hypothetical protein